MTSEAEKACPLFEVRTEAAFSTEAAIRCVTRDQALARAMGLQEDVCRAMAGYAVSLGWCGEEAASKV